MALNLTTLECWKIYSVLCLSLRNTLKAFNDFKKQATKVYEVMFFWCVKVYIFWNFIQCTVYWDKTRVLFFYFIFFSRALTRSFTLISLFFHRLKHKIHFSKNLWGIFNFQVHLVFIKVCIYVQQKALTVWL